MRQRHWVPAFAGTTILGIRGVTHMTEMGNGVQKTPVIPATAGIQGIHFAAVKKPMDSRCRGNDEIDNASVTNDAGVTHFRDVQ
jgi:hypothetical protein